MTTQRNLTALFLVLLCPVFVLAQSAESGGSRLRDQTLRSALLDEERRLLIRLPRHYEQDKNARYPVLYKFDGDNQLSRYDQTIDVLSSIDAIPDLIVVAIPNARGQRNRDLTPASLHQEEGANGSMGKGDMGRGDRFLDFLEREVIPHIDRQFRTTDTRLLAGHSRGALLVLQSLLTQPDLFRARFVFSAPLTRDEGRLLKDTREFFRRQRATHRSFLYCNWGEAENEGMNQSYKSMKELLASEAPKSLRWVVERARAANHQQTQVIALPSALQEYFRSDPGNPPAQQNRTARATSQRPSANPATGRKANPD